MNSKAGSYLLLGYGIGRRIIVIFYQMLRMRSKKVAFTQHKNIWKNMDLL